MAVRDRTTGGHRHIARAPRWLYRRGDAFALFAGLTVRIALADLVAGPTARLALAEDRDSAVDTYAHAGNGLADG